MTEEERKKWQEALRKASLGPQGPMGPNGPLFTGTGTISTPKPKSNFQKIKDAAYGVLPQGAYGTGQTVGPLATQMNPVPSMKRTFTGENAGKYLNFNNGLNWKQRLGLGLEDAINIGSIAIPALRAAKAGPNALVERQLAESIARYRAPELFDYGVHVTNKPNLRKINSTGRTGEVAGDSEKFSTYFWRLSPLEYDIDTVGDAFWNQQPVSIRWGDKDLAEQAANESQRWARLVGRKPYDKPSNSTITAYLTKSPRGWGQIDGNWFDRPDLLKDPVWNNEAEPMPSMFVGKGNSLDVVDKTYGISQRPELKKGSKEAYDYVKDIRYVKIPPSEGNDYYPEYDIVSANDGIYEDVSNMIKKYARQIADNNKRIRYRDGMMPPSTAAERFKNNRR